MSAAEPVLSVVIAAASPSPTLTDALRSLAVQATGRRVEVLVVAAAGGDETRRLVEPFPEVRFIQGAERSLVPQLWARGIECSSGDLVALTLGTCVPDTRWIATAFAWARASPAEAGLGGPILPPPGGSGRDWAAYLVRYSAYLAVADGVCEEIPGDNAVYRRSALDAYWKERGDGFWETLFHRELRLAGQGLRFATALRVRLGSSYTRRFTRLRFQHGRHFGSTRPLASPLLRLPMALSAPLVAATLLLRLRRRVLAARPQWRSRWLLALPWTALFVGSWALGECSGYAWRRRGQ